MATLSQVEKGDEVVIQLVVGGAINPSAVPRDLPSPTASWWEILSGNVPNATSEIRNSVKEKTSSYRLNCVMRIGSHAQDEAKQRSYLLSLFSSLKTLEQSGMKLYLSNENPNHLNNSLAPWRYPLKLSVKELANLFLLPTGESSFLGVKDIHPKILLPPRDVKIPPKDKLLRPFAETLNENPDERQPLYLSDEAGSKHCHIVGPTGCGKSALIEQMFLSDVASGKGAILLDPKFSLVSSIVEKIPEHRLEDVVILNLADTENPVGLNPLLCSDDNSSEQVSEFVLSALKSLFKDTWGVFTEDILQAAILTLARNKDKGVTLLHIPMLLNNAGFRRSMTANLDDKLGLETYWSYFNGLSDNERNRQLSAVQNKLRVLLMRPALRGVLGQAKPKFNLSDVFKKNAILLVPLNTSIVGKTTAEIIGSLLIGMVWNIALKQAEIPEIQRQDQKVSFYIDEFQVYLKQNGDTMEEMLSMARSLGVQFIFCHQNLEQISSKSLKESIMANARNKIFFGTTSKKDAKEFTALGAPDSLSEADYYMLPQFQIYTYLVNNPSTSRFISGKTFPPKPSLRNSDEIFIRSKEKYGAKNLAEIEQSYIDLIEKNETQIDVNNSVDEEMILGRSRRKPAKKDN